jgi:hypothetical protein
MQAVRAAEEVARYRRAQLSAIKLAGDINAKVPDSASLDELIAKLNNAARLSLHSPHAIPNEILVAGLWSVQLRPGHIAGHPDPGHGPQGCLPSC